VRVRPGARGYGLVICLPWRWLTAGPCPGRNLHLVKYCALPNIVYCQVFHGRYCVALLFVSFISGLLSLCFHTARSSVFAAHYQIVTCPWGSWSGLRFGAGGYWGGAGASLPVIAETAGMACLPGARAPGPDRCTRCRRRGPSRAFTAEPPPKTSSQRSQT